MSRQGLLLLLLMLVSLRPAYSTNPFAPTTFQESTLPGGFQVQLYNAPYPIIALLSEMKKAYESSSAQGRKDFATFAQPLLDQWRNPPNNIEFNYELAVKETRDKLLSHAFLRKPGFERHLAIIGWLYDKAVFDNKPRRVSIEFEPLLLRYLATLDSLGEEKLAALSEQDNALAEPSAPTIGGVLKQIGKLSGTMLERRDAHLRLLRQNVTSLTSLTDLNLLFFGEGEESPLRQIYGKGDLPLPLEGDKKSFTESFVSLYFEALGILVRSAGDHTHPEIWRGIGLIQNWYPIDEALFGKLSPDERIARVASYKSLVAQKLRAFVALYLAVAPSVQEGLRRANRVAEKVGIENVLERTEPKLSSGRVAMYPAARDSPMITIQRWESPRHLLEINDAWDWEALLKITRERPLCVFEDSPRPLVFHRFLTRYVQFFVAGVNPVGPSGLGARPPFSKNVRKLFYQRLLEAQTDWSLEEKIETLQLMGPNEMRVEYAKYLFETQRRDLLTHPQSFLDFLAAFWLFRDPSGALASTVNNTRWWRTPFDVGATAEPWVEEFFASDPKTDHINRLYEIVGIGAYLVKKPKRYFYHDSLSLEKFAARTQQWLERTQSSELDLEFLDKSTERGELFLALVREESPTIASELEQSWQEAREAQDQKDQEALAAEQLTLFQAQVEQVEQVSEECPGWLESFMRWLRRN